MKQAHLSILCLIVLLPSQVHAQTEKSRNSLVDQGLRLQRLQEEVVQGNERSYSDQAHLLREMAAEIKSTCADCLMDRRALGSLLLYTLSGGSPRVVLDVLKRVQLGDEDRKLIHGAVNYKLGRISAAKDSLMRLDPLKTTAELGPYLAFMQSMITKGEDPGMAMNLLDRARLLAPGSPMEESSLREALPISASASDTDRAMTVARQYLTRFPRSIYAKIFIRDLVAAISALHIARDAGRMTQLRVRANGLAVEPRVELLLGMARAELVDGSPSAASEIAAIALASGPLPSQEVTRATLYSIASRVQRDNSSTLTMELSKLERSSLSATDVAILQAAKYLVKHSINSANSEPREDDDTTTAYEPQIATIGRAEAALAGANDLDSEPSE